MHSDAERILLCRIDVSISTACYLVLLQSDFTYEVLPRKYFNCLHLLIMMFILIKYHQ